MASIQIDIPDAQANRVLDAFATRYGWTDQLGVTKAEFAKAQVAKMIRETVKQEEVRQAQLAAGNAVSDTTVS